MPYLALAPFSHVARHRAWCVLPLASVFRFFQREKGGATRLYVPVCLVCRRIWRQLSVKYVAVNGKPQFSTRLST